MNGTKISGWDVRVGRGREDKNDDQREMLYHIGQNKKRSSSLRLTVATPGVVAMLAKEASYRAVRRMGRTRNNSS